MKELLTLGVICALIVSSLCAQKSIPVIIDTDANNELDDQHALAYLFFNTGLFEIKGVTVNATFNGGDVESHFKEAQRVMQLCDVNGQYPLLKGADKDFDSIKGRLSDEAHDGHEAIDFIIDEARKSVHDQLVLIPIGKLTNIALAIKKAPEIMENIIIVWLGSNYPHPGEYNLVNDIPAMNFILDQDVAFEMVTVRYGEDTGSDAVRITPMEVQARLSGAGPEVEPVEGRNGGKFTNFGDYSVDLFSKIDLHGDPPSRALFDVVALAVLKEPGWGTRRLVPAPHMVESVWVDRHENARRIALWENFDSKSIVDDFCAALEQAGDN